MQSVSLPVWLLLLLGLFAAWAAVEHVVLPALRWLMRRRIEAVLQELGPRLQLELPPLKLARREVLIERLRHDERVREAVEQEARRSGEPVKRVQARAEELRARDRAVVQCLPVFPHRLLAGASDREVAVPGAPGLCR